LEATRALLLRALATGGPGHGYLGRPHVHATPVPPPHFAGRRAHRRHVGRLRFIEPAVVVHGHPVGQHVDQPGRSATTGRE
ncbi:MAG: hypothetical protein M3016_00645, partial [Actinomycetota bacterium]|nr:hypothetical protein [Actinomycetota bacterium]